MNFKPRPVEGVPSEAKQVTPQLLLLDGQQRMTSLYQVTLRGKVVETVTPKKKVKRWFYIDLRKALDPTADREEAIIGIPEDRFIRAAFGREVVLDLASATQEYASLMYPVSQVFDWDNWQDGFDDYWVGDQNKPTRDEFRTFKKQVLENFKSYHVPVITLDRSTSKEAVCVVFEKVNTGGKALDAFRLVTAMYAAAGHELRKDWYGDDSKMGRHRRFAETLRPAGQDAGIIAGVGNTDFLQAVSLFHTRDRRRLAEKAGKQGKELPAVTGNRQALLNLPLDEYKKYQTQVEQGFVQCGEVFAHAAHLPYLRPSLSVANRSLAAILADIGEDWEHEANRAKLIQWYWNGVFGELYGSAVETRIARDFMEVPAWLKGGPDPSTVSETMFRVRPAKNNADASFRGLQRRQRFADEGRIPGFSVRPKIRPYRILWRECGYPSRLPARLVQEARHQAEYLRFHH